MIASTNSLRTIARKAALPAIAAAAFFAGGAFYVNHSSVHAAASGYGAPLDDSSVSSLVALDNAVEAVAARVTPAVVNVSVTAKGSPDSDEEGGGAQGNIDPQQLPPAFRQFFGFGGGNGHVQIVPQQPQIEHGIGSGVILTPDGYILTNNHVVDGAIKLNVTLNDRRIFAAKVVGTDPLNDLAVIKVDAHNLPTIVWGDSTQLHPGQTVLAFGSPFGYLQFSVTRGIISALNRPNPFANDARKPGAFIQTDAAINPGNSGGALVNAHGELIGINSSIITGSGQFEGAGFAIPSQIARATADSIIKTGAVHHGYLGISMNDVTPENATFFNLPDANGAIVSAVTPDSPAASSGIKQGDVLREINGNKIANGSALQVAVSQTNPGAHIELGILRDGKPQTIHITVGEFSKKTEVASSNDSGPNQKGRLGLAVDNLTPDLRNQLNVPDQLKGVAVQNVRPASPADDAGLAPGDVILEVNRRPVESAENFVNQVHDVPTGKDILLLVWSRGGTTYRVLHTDSAEQSGM